MMAQQKGEIKGEAISETQKNSKYNSCRNREGRWQPLTNLSVFKKLKEKSVIRIPSYIINVSVASFIPHSPDF